MNSNEIFENLINRLIPDKSFYFDKNCKKFKWSISEPSLINGKQVEIQEAKISFGLEDGTIYNSYKEILEEPIFNY